MVIAESGQDVHLFGKAGELYRGKIYAEKTGTSNLSGGAIVCLTNSRFDDNGWHHHMNSIYNTPDVNEALEHFKTRDDISHVIIIPHQTIASNGGDDVDNLIRNYLHG